MKEWIEIHPYEKSDNIDHEYLNVSKKIFNALLCDEDLVEIDSTVLRQLSLILTAYLEDVVSNYGLWSAFRKIHKEKYARWIPFYDVNEEMYFFDEINLEDVKFLCWMVLQNEAKEGQIMHPEGLLVAHLANVIYPVLDEAFEEVPINERLYNYFRNPESYKDFMAFRISNDLLFFSSYLFMKKGRDCVESLLIKGSEDGHDEQMIYSMIVNAAFQAPMPPLMVCSHLYLAELIDDMKNESGYLKEISYVKMGVFEYCGRDDNSYFLKNVNSDISYEVDKISCHIPEDLPLHQMIITQLVRYCNTWNINGTVSYMSQGDIPGNFREEHDLKEHNRKLYDAFMKKNGNIPIVFTSRYSDIKEILAQYNNVSYIPDFPYELRSRNNYVLFADRDKGMIVALDIAGYIKHPDNPFYNKAAAEKEAVAILADRKLCPKPMRRYLIENKLIPDAMLNPVHGVQLAKDLIQNNMSFLGQFILADS